MGLQPEIIDFISSYVLGLGTICFFFGILAGISGGILICNFITDFFEISRLAISKILEKIRERKGSE